MSAKLPRACRILAIVIAGVMIIAAGLFFWFRQMEKDNRLAHVPASLNVSNIVYAKEEAWGFGPGGNESGVIAYELPEAIARQILRDGITFFNRIPASGGDSREWRGRYESWQPTPVFLEGSDADTNMTHDHQLANYLNRYGFGIPVDPTVEQQVNQAIAAPGSFAARGRIGVLIVMPSIRRVVYIYNG